ncbi:MAG TPA: FmdB family zinc ribbon protein [Burkholderiaceae bacterium]|jgi:putative FmdB family regulatory protein
MPIYAYRCTTCGHAKDVLQKMSDPLLTVCPSCGAATFAKQVTAAGFQLKGSGWYVTDFRGGDSAKGKPAAGEGADGAKTDAAKPDASTAAPAPAASKSDAAPAPAPAPSAPAAPPAAGAK